MRRILLASVAISGLTLGAIAQEAAVQPPNAPAADRATNTDPATTSSTNRNVDAGVAVGGTAGAVTGAVVGGPVGAVIGGFAGAMLGSAAAVPDPAVDYVVAHPTEQVVLEGGVSEGAHVPDSVTLTPIPDYPDYAYIYTDGRPVIVEREKRRVVYSPGYVVPERTVTYVRENRRDPVRIRERVTVGSVMPSDVELAPIPDDPAYAYVYTDDGPVLVNRGSRRIVWVQGG
ncbi:MAG TPA: DUF1236 domain-containing protein [Rhizobiaceae bacterium]|nr:DUF1236 domain-containing protein [Rhizobiaceae bacterium]